MSETTQIQPLSEKENNAAPPSAKPDPDFKTEGDATELNSNSEPTNCEENGTSGEKLDDKSVEKSQEVNEASVANAGPTEQVEQTPASEPIESVQEPAVVNEQTLADSSDPSKSEPAKESITESTKETEKIDIVDVKATETNKKVESNMAEPEPATNTETEPSSEPEPAKEPEKKIKSPEPTEEGTTEKGEASRDEEAAAQADKGDPPTQQVETPADQKTATPTKSKTSKRSPKKEVTPTKKEASPTKIKATPTKKEERKDEPMDTDEPQLGLLERPVEIQTGKRSRRRVERFTEVVESPAVPEKKVSVPAGRGCQLADCPIIMEYVDKNRVDSLKNFHRLLFNVTGKPAEIRKNIRNFSGFAFDNESNEYKRKLTALSKLGVLVIKSFCDLLSLDKSGSKDSLVDRVLSYLMLPTSDGKQAKEKQPKAPAAGSKRKRGAVKPKPDEEEEGEDEEEDGEEDAEEEPVSKRSRRSSPAKKSPGKTPAKREAARMSAPKKTPARRTERGARMSTGSAPSTRKRRSRGKKEESEEEPDGAPSNSRIKKEISKILKSADLEKVTMKTVRQQIVEMFPDQDLSDRTPFIKSTVKEILGA